MCRQSLCADDLEIIGKYSDTVYRMAYSLVKNRYDADDVHQEVFIRYLCKRPRFENPEHEKAWFLRVTVNLCKNLWKAAWRQKTISLGEEYEEKAGGFTGPESEVDSESGQIIAIVKKLSQKYRIVIHLFYYEEMSIDEISRVLQMKPSTVRTRLTRARARLKVLLENESE